MPQQSTRTTLEEAIVAMVRRKGLAYVERQYDSGLMSPVIEPAFEQWKREQAKHRGAPRAPMALVVTMLLVVYFAAVWSI